MPVTQLLVKLVNVGVFPSSLFLPPSQPSFFRSTLATIRGRFRQDDDQRYSKFWTDILNSLPFTVAQQTIFSSLCSSLSQVPSPLGVMAQDRGIVVQQSLLLRAMFGTLQPESDVWNSVLGVMLTRDWNESHARIFVCWAAGAIKDTTNSKGQYPPLILVDEISIVILAALQALLARAMDVWCASDHVKHSLLSRHHCELIYIRNCILC